MPTFIGPNSENWEYLNYTASVIPSVRLSVRLSHLVSLIFVCGCANAVSDTIRHTLSLAKTLHFAYVFGALLQKWSPC